MLACSDGEGQSNEGIDSGSTASDTSSADGQDGGTSDDGGTGSGGGGSDSSETGDDGSTGSGGTSGSSDTETTTSDTETTTSDTETTTSDTGTTTSDTGNTTSDTGSTTSDTGSMTTTTTDTTGTTTDTKTTGTETKTATSNTSTTSGQAGVEYVAYAMYGGLDRIFIRKADYDEALCFSLVVVWPGGMPLPFPDVTTPQQWAVEAISVSQGTTGCLDPCAGVGVPGQAADTASGYVDFVFNQPGQFPETLDISVSMTFPQGQPWIPAADSMDALDLPVETCR